MKTKITSKVLEDISKRLQGESIIEKEKEDKTLKALIVLNGSNIDLSEKIENIKKLKNRGIKVSLAFSFMAERLLDTQRIINILQPLEIYKEEDIIKLKDISKEYSIIIGPNITMNTLSKISLGMIDTFIPNLIWTFLYQGKKVYLDFNQVKKYLGEETKNKVPQAKTVITEKDIISMSSNNKLILPKGTIITPLAKDKAREKNIKIEIK
ncbi:MAG: flavoprotein [Paenibacillus dendritiformis]|nr:flavoprotein [Paenibacillus dendritiformis]